jgi:hypothetical protein
MKSRAIFYFSLPDHARATGVDRTKGLSMTRRFFSGVLLTPLYCVLISTLFAPASNADVTLISFDTEFSATFILGYAEQSAGCKRLIHRFRAYVHKLVNVALRVSHAFHFHNDTLRENA